MLVINLRKFNQRWQYNSQQQLYQRRVYATLALPVLGIDSLGSRLSDKDIKWRLPWRYILNVTENHILDSVVEF